MTKLTAYKCDRCREVWIPKAQRTVDSPESCVVTLTDGTLGGTQAVDFRWDQVCRSCVHELYHALVGLDDAAHIVKEARQ